MNKIGYFLIVMLFLICFLPNCQPKQNVLNDNQIGEQIRKARLTKQLSQQNLADSLQISAAALSLIEDGFAAALPSSLKKIETILEIKINQ